MRDDLCGMRRAYRTSRQLSRMKKNASCGSSSGKRAQARHRRVFSLDRGLRTSRFIGEPLTLHAHKGNVGTAHVINSKPFAVRIPEIELGQVALQMRFADMEVATSDASFEDGKVIFYSVGVGVSAYIFLGTVVYDFMAKVFPHVAVLSCIVGTKKRFSFDLRDQYGTELRSGYTGDVQGTDAAITLYKREHSFFAPASTKPLSCALTLMPVALFAADKCLVGFNGFTFTAKLAKGVGAHSLTDAMSKEPSGLHAALKHSLYLASRNAFLAGAHQMNNLQPEMQRQVRGFENGSNPDGKGLLAGIALVQSDPGGLTVQLAYVFAVAPQKGQVGPSGHNLDST